MTTNIRTLKQNEIRKHMFFFFQMQLNDKRQLHQDSG